jgi:hypothetical protein
METKEFDQNMIDDEEPFQLNFERRFGGIPFQTASGLSDTMEGERKLELSLDNLRLISDRDQ